MLVIGGLGLYGFRDVSYGLERYIRDADAVFLEPYTSVLPGFSLEGFKSRFGKTPVILSRKDLEDENGEKVLAEAARGLAVLVTIGNPLLATTHSALVVEAKRRGIDVILLPAASVIDGIILETGLHIYKIGKTATLVYPQPSLGFYPYSTYEAVKENLKRGLHTILLLDLKVEENVYMGLGDAAKLLLELEEKVGENVFDNETLLIGVARATAPDSRVYVEPLSRMRNVDAGPPPHTLIVPGLLHDSEAEYLSARWGVVKEVFSSWNSTVKTKYMSI